MNMRMALLRRHYASQQGVGLIEVLVAVLILSIGLLGVGLLQTRSLSGTNSSMTRTLAVAATYSLIEAMRADRSQALAAAYNSSIQASSCPAAGTTLATYQLNQWCNNELKQRVGENAIATVSCAATGVCTVTVTFYTLDCGRSSDGQTSDGLCTQTVDTGTASEARAQQIVTKALL